MTSRKYEKAITSFIVSFNLLLYFQYTKRLQKLVKHY